MKQFTYKEFDIITGIVFTNLCCDMLNRFDIDMFNDASAKPMFEALANYVGNNIEIKEEYEMIEIEGLKTEISKMESYLNEHYFEDGE